MIVKCHTKRGFLCGEIRNVERVGFWQMLYTVAEMLRGVNELEVE